MVEMVQSSVVYRDQTQIENLMDTKQNWSESNDQSFRADFSSLSLRPEFSRSLPVAVEKQIFKNNDFDSESFDDSKGPWKSSDGIWSTSLKANVERMPNLDRDASPSSKGTRNLNMLSPQLSNSDETLKKADETSEMNVESLETPHLIKPAMLYRLIRQKVGPKEFEEFSNVIARFNEGIEDSNETIKCISKIVKDTDLFDQMKIHILNAIQ